VATGGLEFEPGKLYVHVFSAIDRPIGDMQRECAGGGATVATTAAAARAATTGNSQYRAKGQNRAESFQEGWGIHVWSS
jgi:hypothetical protein